MKPTWQTDDGSLSLRRGDCRVILPTFADDSFTACVTDPPYELAFMGKKWDASGVAFQPQTWAEVLRVLKPGAVLLAFGGTRTYHRMTCAIEDAGFEIRDCIMWVYGSGFPKSLDISKAIDKAAGAEREVSGTNPHHRPNHIRPDNAWRGAEGRPQSPLTSPMLTSPATDSARLWNGYGTALKPAVEPIVVAMKPLSGTFAQNALEHGVAGINVDGGRIVTDETIHQTGEKVDMPRGACADGYDRPNATMFRTGKPKERGGPSQPLGRWPANLIHDGSGEVLAGFPQTVSNGGKGPHKIQATDARNANRSAYGDYGATNDFVYGDAGNASRFFYCAKASRAERGEGNKHPTVKPLALMEYLVKLVTMPTGTRILDPFAGSGTTLLACYNAFVEAVGIDLEVDHVDISGGRIAAVANATPLFEKPPAVQRELIP